MIWLILISFSSFANKRVEIYNGYKSCLRAKCYYKKMAKSGLDDKLYLTPFTKKTKYCMSKCDKWIGIAISHQYRGESIGEAIDYHLKLQYMLKNFKQQNDLIKNVGSMIKLRKEYEEKKSKGILD